MKRKIDIEKLVQWALIEELPKGRPVSDSVTAYVVARRQSSRRMMESSGAQIDALGIAPGVACRDAEIIRDELAAIAQDCSFESLDDVRKLFRGDIQGLGDIFAAQVRIVRVNPQALVLNHAVRKTRPDWDFTPRPYQEKKTYRDAVGSLREKRVVLGDDGTGNLVELTPNRGSKAMRQGAYDIRMQPRSPVEWNNPRPWVIGECRAEYVAWRDALMSLKARLGEGLERFEITGPTAAEFPWIVDDEPKTRILPVIAASMPMAVQPVSNKRVA